MINEREIDYLEMSDEEISELDLSYEQLAEIYTEKSVFAAKITLEMDEKCYRKFSVKTLSDTETMIYRKFAARLDVSDEEMQILEYGQAALRMEQISLAREIELEKCAELGEAYESVFTFEDRTDGYGVN